MFHLTVPEAALGAAAITATAGVIGGLVVNGAAKAREHLSRLWNQEIEVYEYLLIQANSWRKMRDVSTHSQQFTPPAENNESQQLYVRLVMFGAPEIRALYDAHTAAHFHWIGLFGENIGIEDPVQRAEKEAEIKAAKEAADQAEQRLISGIQQRVQRVPTKANYINIVRNGIAARLTKSLY